MWLFCACKCYLKLSDSSKCLPRKWEWQVAFVMFCMSLSVQWMCWTVCTGLCATVVNAFDACVVFGMWLSSSCTGVTRTLQTDSLSTQRQIGCCYTGRFDGHRVTSPFYWQSFIELFWNLEGHRVAAVRPLVAVFSNQHEKEMSTAKMYSKELSATIISIEFKIVYIWATGAVHYQ